MAGQGLAGGKGGGGCRIPPSVIAALRTGAEAAGKRREFHGPAVCMRRENPGRGFRFAAMLNCLGESPSSLKEVVCKPNRWNIFETNKLCASLSDSHNRRKPLMRQTDERYSYLGVAWCLFPSKLRGDLWWYNPVGRPPPPPPWPGQLLLHEERLLDTLHDEVTTGVVRALPHPAGAGGGGG